MHPKPTIRQCAFLLSIIALALLHVSPSWADVVVIVNPENPVNHLSLHEVKTIFMGRLRQLPETNQIIEVLDQAHTSLTFKTFYMDIIDINLSKLARYRASYVFSGQGTLPTELTDHQSIRQHVAQHNESIGYIDSQYVNDTVKVVFIWPESPSP